MKKIIYLSFLCICSSVTFAQLKVTSDGKVGIGINQTPASKLSVGTLGYQYVGCSIDDDITPLKTYSFGNSTDWGNRWATSILAEVMIGASFRGGIGVCVGATSATPTNYGKAIGISSIAGNATSGYNWAVIGCLYGNNNGAGVLGTVGDYSLGYNINDGKYAGYFVGNVKVTGTINSIIVGNSDIRYKDNIEEFSKSNSNVLSNITRLSPISYNFKQIYIEEEGRADSLKTGGKISNIAMYDEKSQMFQKKHFGLIAQDLQKIYPDLVYENDNGYLSVNYTEMIPL